MPITKEAQMISERKFLNICQALNERHMTVSELCTALDQTKNSINYSIKQLLKSGCIKLASAEYMNKKYTLTDKPYIPELLDINIEEIVSQKTMKKQVAQVYLNSMRDPADYRWQRKKSSTVTNMQSSMQSWSTA